MPTRGLGLLLLLPRLTAGVSLAEEPVHAIEGKIEAIEMYRTSENKPVNPGTIVGGIAGGLVGHQIGICAWETACASMATTSTASDR